MYKISISVYQSNHSVVLGVKYFHPVIVVGKIKPVLSSPSALNARDFLWDLLSTDPSDYA